MVAGLAGGCVSGEQLVRERAKKLIKPASMPYALTQMLAADAAKLKREGRIQQDLRLPGYQGRKIAVWVMDSRKDGRPGGTVVLLHPLLTGKSWLFDHGEELAGRGWDVVLPDLPAHGMSDGPYVTWGAKEKHDIKAVVDALLASDSIARPLYVAGSSLGGMVAIQYAALDERCEGVLAVAPPIDFRTISRRILMLELPGQYEDALAKAAEMADFDPNEASSVEAARRLDCPLIVAQGFLDFIVPYDWAKKITDASAGRSRLITLPVHGHAAELGRPGWLADRIDELVEMSQADETPPPADDDTG
jgi:pimeloyl-ACP methyl ester carboxylesterase